MNGNSISELSSHVSALREGAAFARSSQRHADNMVVWIIGLSAGAVIALPTTYSFLNLRSVPEWILGLLLAPFVLGVLVGIAFRLYLAKLMAIDDKYFFGTIQALELLKLGDFEGQEGLKQFRHEVLAIMEARDADIAKLKAGVERLHRSWGWLERWPYIFFAVGVVFAAAITVACAPSGIPSNRTSFDACYENGFQILKETSPNHSEEQIRLAAWEECAGK